MSEREKAYREKLRAYAHGHASFAEVRRADPHNAAIQEAARQIAVRHAGSESTSESIPVFNVVPSKLVSSK